MNSPATRILLVMVALLLAAGGYYEYNRQIEEIAHRQQAIQDSIKAVNQLQKDVAALQAGNAALTKELTDTQGKVTELTSQIAASQSDLAEAKSSTDQLKKAADDANAAADKAKKDLDTVMHPPAPTNNLGTIVARNGKTYEDCLLLKVETNDIVVRCSTGVVSIFYPFLPAPLQVKFGYDPLKPGDMSASQVAFQEKIRMQAGN